MRLEKLSKGYFKKFIIVIFVISIIGITFINRSKAKYRVTQSIQIVNGEVNYKVPDLNVLALYKQKLEGNTSDDNYEPVTDVPINGYVLNTDKSYCTVPNSDEKITKNMAYDSGKVSIDISKKGTKCYVWLDIYRPTLVDVIKKQVQTNDQPQPDFSHTSCKSGSNTEYDDENCDEETNGVYTTTDNFGTSYYYRGTIDNNWIKFGKIISGNNSGKDIWWRIIRVNGNNTVRLIYAGAELETDTPSITGSSTQIMTSGFGTDEKDKTQVYYKYNSTDSKMKIVLDNWYLYTSNLKSLESKIDGTAGFCNDIEEGGTNPDGKERYFKPYDRLAANKTPNLKCLPTSNLYTTSDGTVGNGKLTNPIGLITLDEISFAGGVQWHTNKGYYLYTDTTYWTMSGAFYSIGYNTTYMGDMSVNGFPNGGVLDAGFGVRPVINLKADTKIVGNGTISNPYIVQ